MSPAVAPLVVNPASLELLHTLQNSRKRDEIPFNVQLSGLLLEERSPKGPPGPLSHGLNGESSAALLSCLFAVIHNKIKNKELMLLIFNKKP